MRTTTTTRQRGVTLRLLDLQALSERALATWQAARPDSAYTSMEPGFAPYAVAEHDGVLYVICNEGVGWTVTEDSPLEVDLYGKSEDSFSMLPNLTATLSVDDVRTLITEEEVDLADHVRSFGSRLESNFAMWYRRLA